MLEGRKYLIEEDAGIITGIAKVPDTLLYPTDDYSHTGGEAIGLLIHMADVETDPVLCMTDEQASYLIKAIKTVRREYRRRNRRRQ